MNILRPVGVTSVLALLVWTGVAAGPAAAPAAAATIRAYANHASLTDSPQQNTLGSTRDNSQQITLGGSVVNLQSGIGFILAAIAKFKAHKENPCQECGFRPPHS